MTEATLQQLIDLSHAIGREERRLTILGEGNVSADAGDGTFWVKASGSTLVTIDETGFARVSTERVLALLDVAPQDDEAIRLGLDDARADDAQPRPSVETFLHALCLTEGQASWVGHAHPDSVLGILCSDHGAQPFRRHLFPDAIVVCGRHVAVVPYVDPGRPLALAIREELCSYREHHGRGPRLLLMENHGPVALGQSASEVLGILMMVDKWARVLQGALGSGTPRYLGEEQADRIEGRPDEHYRRGLI